MRAFLTTGDRTDFLALYPEWSARFRTYENFIRTVVDQVVVAIRTTTNGNRAAISKTPAGHVAQVMYDHITRVEKIIAHHRDVEGIVRDYVTNPAYAFLFMRALSRQ